MRYHLGVSNLCEHKRAREVAVCPPDCGALVRGVFERVRLAPGTAPPAADPAIVDVAVLDMNHGWPNVGHDSVVAAVQEVACGLADELVVAGLRLRTISFDVRRGGQVPAGADERFAVFVGTGGPGHLDPRLNDGRDPHSQGIVEDPAWEAPLFRLFDAIARREDASLLAVCHTFGLICRWLGVAEARARGPEKGGKSEGVRDNLLTDDGRAHPLFAALAQRLPVGGRLRVLDSRNYDLIPRTGAARRGSIVATETLGVDGPPGEAMTMFELARDHAGRMPRIFGVNHHPEIVDRANLMGMLRLKLERGDIAPAWYERRVRLLARQFPDDGSDGSLRLTSEFTFLGPLRFHLTRAVRRRAASLGNPFDAHEDAVERLLTGPAPHDVTTGGPAGPPS